MNLAGVWHLGVRYLRCSRAKTILLVAAFSLVWFLPPSVAILVRVGEQVLQARAASTPLLVGAPGSPLELVFNGLYFTKPKTPKLPFEVVEEIQSTDFALAIPLYARFASGEHRIVGTSLDYFAFRKLEIANGRSLLRTGECVVGAEVARRHGIRVGDAVISSPEALFDLAGVYPLKMTVVGVLGANESPDDAAIFTDLRTCWIIEGLGHGHEEAALAGADERLATEGNDPAIRLNASVRTYHEITPENRNTFHFHGDLDALPITAVVVVPRDTKSQALLKGRLDGREDLLLVEPAGEIQELFATVFRVQGFVMALLAGIGLATVAIGVLVFLLSYRLRRAEFAHLRLLGAEPASLAALVVFEAVFVMGTSLLIALTGLLVLGKTAPAWMGTMLG
jgi:putative ABC transport system permease protein